MISRTSRQTSDATPRNRALRDRRRTRLVTQPRTDIEEGKRADSNTGSKTRREDQNSKALKKLVAKKLKRKAARQTSPAKPPFPTRPKAEQKVRLGNGRRLEIGGARDDFDTCFIWFRDGATVVLTELGDWHSGSSDGLAKLKKGGIIFVQGAAEIRTAVDRIKRFCRAPIVTRPGWSKHGFGLIDGRVLIPKGKTQPWVAYEKVHGLLGHGGTLEGWQQQVAAPLADQWLASFCLMIVFAPALLLLSGRSDNFGFELAGDPACGKSTLQRLIASAAGPVIGPGDCRYWQTLNSTMNALETRLLEFNDMPVILDEAGLIPGAGKAEVRALETRDLAFRMANGQTKHRLGERPGPRSRGVYIMSTNCPTTLLVGDAYAAESGAIADRLMTLSASADRPHGIFDYLPPSFPSKGMFAETIERAAGEHFGHALPAYLQFLVTQREANPKRLERTLREDIAHFLKVSNTNLNDGSQRRVAKAFALVYSGGKFAQRAKVLPPTFDCEKSALVALAIHRAHGRPIVSFDDRLRSVLNGPATIDIKDVDLSSMTEAQRAKNAAYLYTGKSHNRELVIPIEQIERVFPDWKTIRDELDVERRLLRSKGRNTRERPVGPKGQQHACYVFQVMDLIE